MLNNQVFSRQPSVKKTAQRRNLNRRVPTELTSLVSQEIENLPETVRNRYLKDLFLTKFVSADTDSPALRRERAIEKWLLQECKNAETNDRLSAMDDEYHILPRVTWAAFRSRAQLFIASAIGDMPSDPFNGGFSGGASTSRGRKSSHPAGKFVGLAHTTGAVSEYVAAVREEIPLWHVISQDAVGEQPHWHRARILQYVPVQGNVLFTVPKKTDIDRVAAKEPDLNMFLQRALGNEISRGLKSKGINLNDQTKNQRLAQYGSKTGHLATIDLSSASDSVCTVLVEQLLPFVWFSYLDDYRSKITMIDGVRHVNEMFSSMGNGFTFELESLLFWAITKTVAYFLDERKPIISVYGDDIICPSAIAEELAWVLSILGFAVNTEKSFWDGPYRESCGKHYHDGFDVSPFFLRAPIERLTDVIRLCNQMRKWADSSTSLDVLDDTLEDLWFFLSSYVPRKYWGGTDYGSDLSLVTRDPAYKRLSVITETVKQHTCMGSYLYWHSQANHSPNRKDAIQTSRRTISVEIYGEKRVAQYGNAYWLSVTPWGREV